MAEEEKGELDLEVAGQKFRTKGYRLMDLICLGGFLLMACTAYLVFEHKAEARDNSKEFAQVIKDSNREVAQALKEAQAQTTEAIRQMAAEQRRANEIGREQTCLLTLPPDRRTNAGDFCKRLSRERDR